MLDKIKEKGIDLFIKIVDEMNYMYEPNYFMGHADYNSYKLSFTFEDWTNIINHFTNDSEDHMCIVAEYVNADDIVLVKWSSENFDELLDMIKEWNDTHKVTNNK